MGLFSWNKIRTWLAECAEPHCVYMKREVPAWKPVVVKLQGFKSSK
jgi:hypothetical protein